MGERGGSLSAGQRQLIALARAELADPALLLLDEATSNLDLATESRVTAAMQRVARDRTTIVIAHRLQTARVADRIAVLEHGPGARDRHPRRAARPRRRLRPHVARVRDCRRGLMSGVEPAVDQVARDRQVRRDRPQPRGLGPAAVVVVGPVARLVDLARG